jgi:hypothetical protein
MVPRTPPDLPDTGLEPATLQVRVVCLCVPIVCICVWGECSTPHCSGLIQTLFALNGIVPPACTLFSNSYASAWCFGVARHIVSGTRLFGGLDVPCGSCIRQLPHHSWFFLFQAYVQTTSYYVTISPYVVPVLPHDKQKCNTALAFSLIISMLQ